MAYIGNQPFTTAFLTDQFSGNGTTTAFTLSAAPANTSSIIVAVTGVLQDPSTYSVTGTTLNFSAAPPSGTGNISVRFLGIPASGVTTTAYRTLTEFTATAGQTTFTPPSYTVGYINVFRNGVMLGTADYTASNGTTVVLVNPASAGDLVVVESFYVSSVLNALPTSGGTLSGPLLLPTNGLSVGSTQLVASGGNVGVGTSSPADSGNYGRALDVNGTTGAAIYARTNGSATNYALIGSYGSDGYVANRGAGSLIFQNNNAERARIDSSGNLLVGTTTDNITATGVRLRGDNIQVAKSGDWSLRTGRTTSTGIVQEIYYNSSRVGDIATNGTGTTYNSASDYRLKENVRPMTGALARVALLKPCTYTWKVNGSAGEGFIAHELQEVVPDAVNGVKDAVDADGNIVPQSIDTSFLVATLTAAIQEQQALINDLTARIAALENKA